jgi:asparagine synthetase B (glutamine-hydrolysing)
MGRVFGNDSATTAYYAGQARTFTLGFDDPANSEMDAARAAASYLGVQNLGILAESGDVRTALDTAARCFGEPFADDAAWSNYLISQFARKHVTVALSGDGGDELFGSYGRYWKRARAAMRSLLGRWRRRGAATGPAAPPTTGGGFGTRGLNRVNHPSLVDAKILRRPVNHRFDRAWLLLVLAKRLDLNA